MNRLSKIILTVFMLFFSCVHIQAYEPIDLEQRIERMEREVNNLQSSNYFLFSERNRLRIGGHIQTQFQWGEKDALLGVGAPNENLERSFNRFGIREGQISIFFQDGIVLTNFQLDMTERAIGVRNAFLQLSDPVWGTNSLRTGIFILPFGHELVYASASRQSPDRSAIVQDLFPGVRDLGAVVNLRAPWGSRWSVLQLNAGLVAGNGRNMQTSSQMDFVGRLSVGRVHFPGATFTGGFSYYRGGVFQGTENVFTMCENRFVENNSLNNRGRYAKREYFGFDLQAVFTTGIGLTQIKTEYIFGQQPGREDLSASWSANIRPAHDTFIRPMRGGYVMLVQELGVRSPFSVVLKYDWYNPNTAVSGNDIGIDGTHTYIADLTRTAFGFGLLWNATRNVRMTAYYELVRMETSTHIDRDFRGDSFTLRLQYRF